MIRKMVRKELLNLARPSHGGEVWKHNTNLIDFSCSLNPLGPPSEIGEIIQENINNITHYPDDQCTNLISTISDHLNIPQEYIIVGCGSTELIKVFAETFIKPDDHIVVCSPTYDEYAFYCKFMGGAVNKLHLRESEDFKIETDSLINQFNGSTKAVFLCNPNNPTSRYENKKKILEIVEECESRNILVFIDEAFIDFLKEGRSGSCVPDVQNYDNLFVSRSLTKIYSIPGIRVGYGVGGKEIIKYMNKARLSWNVGVLDQIVASELIQNCDSYIEKTVEFVESEKRNLYKQVSLIQGYEPVKPDVNFIFIKIEQLGIKSTDFKNIMINKGFLIRDCVSFGDSFSNYIRIAVKNRDLNTLLLEALKTVSEDMLSSSRSKFETVEEPLSRF
ncbi:MAG: histidinol-phosphate transaminase [Candidatus Jordarchaeaceae archaeon]